MMKPQRFSPLAGLLLGAGLTGLPDPVRAEITFKFVRAGDARQMVKGPKAPGGKTAISA